MNNMKELALQNRDLLWKNCLNASENCFEESSVEGYFLGKCF